MYMCYRENRFRENIIMDYIMTTRNDGYCRLYYIYNKACYFLMDLIQENTFAREETGLVVKNKK